MVANPEGAPVRIRPVLTENPAADTVLWGIYDAGKAVGKVIESQSAPAWNERIIRTINEKVIPKLTPDQLAFVAKHHKAIETGAKVAGISIATSERVVIFGLSIYAQSRFQQHRYEKSMDKTLQTPWFAEIKKSLEAQGNKRPEDFVALAGTLWWLVMGLKKNTQNADILAGKVNTHETQRALLDAVKGAYRERKKYEGKLYWWRPYVPPAEVDEQARHMYTLWRRTNYLGREGLATIHTTSNPPQETYVPRKFDPSSPRGKWKHPKYATSSLEAQQIELIQRQIQMDDARRFREEHPVKSKFRRLRLQIAKRLESERARKLEEAKRKQMKRDRFDKMMEIFRNAKRS